jgi:hypothetical protein
MLLFKFKTLGLSEVSGRRFALIGDSVVHAPPSFPEVEKFILNRSSQVFRFDYAYKSRRRPGSNRTARLRKKQRKYDASAEGVRRLWSRLSIAFKKED